jgi:hypothetical protein
MRRTTLLSRLVGAWLLVEALLYWLLVPQVVTTMNFLWITVVLFLLIVVAITKWRDSGFDDSIATVLYDAEHPTGSRR